MAGQKAKTSKLLLLISLLACLGIGLLVTQTSHIPSSIPSSKFSLNILSGSAGGSKKDSASESPDQTTVLDPAVIVSEAPSTVTSAAAEPSASGTVSTSPAIENTEKEEVTVTVSAPYNTFRAAKAAAASPEAASGTWTKTNNDWYFMVNSQAYLGWLFDTDKRIYYLDPATGIMLKGWQAIDGKQYYFNNDGVLQCGQLLIDGTLYEFDETGALISAPPAAPAASTDNTQQ